MKPRVILAALDEYTRPAGLGPGQFEAGCAHAEAKARRLIADAHSDPDRSPDSDDLPAIEAALRAWIAEGPDWDTEEYQDGYLHVQETIRRILDGDRGEIRDLLDDARQRAERMLSELD